MTAGLALASFAACIVFTRRDHNVAFYIMPTRGWEFILGGIVPVLVPLFRRCSGKAIDATAIGGTAAIAFVVMFDVYTQYPSFRAALPAVGAMLVITSGVAAPQNVIARALATRPMVAVGLVSYAWYLWHWPLLSSCAQAISPNTMSGRR